MNREIKFRFWVQQEWDDFGEPIYEIIDGDDYAFDEYLPINQIFKSIEDNGGAVMQYTGFMDKDGKEICEGDIVNIDNSEPEEHGAYDPVTVCKKIRGCFTLEDLAGGHWTRNLYHQPHRLTILGNIFENPELLNKES